MNDMWILGVLALAGGAILFSWVRRWRRYSRTRRHGLPVDMTVVSSSLSTSHGLRGTVWMQVLFAISLPNGRERRIQASVSVRSDRLDELEPGCVFQGRVDPRGESNGYRYLQSDFGDLLLRKTEEAQ